MVKATSRPLSQSNSDRSTLVSGVDCKALTVAFTCDGMSRICAEGRHLSHRNHPVLRMAQPTRFAVVQDLNFAPAIDRDMNLHAMLVRREDHVRAIATCPDRAGLILEEQGLILGHRRNRLRYGVPLGQAFFQQIAQRGCRPLRRRRQFCVARSYAADSEATGIRGQALFGWV